VGGQIGHVTGTNTFFYIYRREQAAFMLLGSIATGTGTATYQLNDKVITDFTHLVDTTKIWIDSKFAFYFSGAATAYVDLLVEERW